MLCTCTGHKGAGAVRSSPIRAFQREPRLLSFRADRLLEGGYEMKLKGNYCTTGRLWLSWQLKPTQGVNYTEPEPGILYNVFWDCHKNAHTSASPALNLQQRVCSDPRELNFQDIAMVNISLAAQKIHLAIEVVSPPLPGSLSHTAFPVWLYKNVVPSLLLQETVGNLHVQEFLCSTDCPVSFYCSPFRSVGATYDFTFLLVCLQSSESYTPLFFFQMRQKTEEKNHLPVLYCRLQLSSYVITFYFFAINTNTSTSLWESSGKCDFGMFHRALWEAHECKRDL